MKGIKEIKQEEITLAPSLIFEAPATEDFGKMLLRISLGALMLLHGGAKLLFGIDPIMGMIAAMGLPPAFAYGVYVGEVVAPVMLIVGLFTRFAAAMVAIDMIVAVLMVQMNNLYLLKPTGGWAIELEALYCLPAIALMFLGGGRYGITRS